MVIYFSIYLGMIIDIYIYHKPYNVGPATYKLAYNPL